MGELVAVLGHSVTAYFRNIRWILLFSLSFLLALAIPFLSPVPSYIALGATFLRTGSMPQLAPLEVIVIALSMLASLFLLSFATVSINLVIKSQRTLTNVRTEVMQGIEKYAAVVFELYLIAWLLLFLIALASYEVRLERVLTPLAAFLIYTLLFYVPTAIVIDEVRPGRAFEVSLRMLFGKPMLFVAWLATGFVLLSLTSLASLSLFPHPLAQYIVLVINALVVLPFLTVMQTQMYLTKYTLL
ncbi:MAG: hypothetical protein QXG98_05875 [Candidatus Micrarchaeia archaeon]